MKRKSLTPWLLFSSRLLLRPLPDISLATWDLATFSQHHCIKNMLPMKIYPYLSYRREINETDVNYTCNLQKVWESSNSLNGNICSLFNLYTICNSSDQRTSFLTRWNAITVNSTTFCFSIFFFGGGRLFFFTHVTYPHPRPTTSTHYPRPTTFSYT